MTFPGGSLFVSYLGSSAGSLYQYDATTGALTSILYTSFSANGPRVPVFGPDGNLYVPDWQTPNVKKFDGTTFAFLGDFLSDAAMFLIAVAFGADRNPLVLDFRSGASSVRKYDAHSGAFLGTIVATGSGGLSVGLAMAVVPSSPVPALGPFAALVALSIALAGIVAFRTREPRRA